MLFEEFQDGGHLGYWKRRIWASLNFHNTPMPPIMFKLNQTYRSVADVIWRFSRWLPWWPSWISERNHFSNSKSLCCPDAFHLLLHPTFKMAGGDIVWRFSRWLTWRPSWISERNDFSKSKSPCDPNASCQVSRWWPSTWQCTGAEVVSRFSRWLPRRPSWRAKRNDLSYSESLCRSDASHQASAQSNLRFGRRCR